uniref:Uncharacterized protein n=1 Tax=Cacopsylla melanoneura TaxID=428564 RepID=A0A8D8L9B7_9HEMI
MVVFVRKCPQIDDGPLIFSIASMTSHLTVIVPSSPHLLFLNSRLMQPFYLSLIISYFSPLTTTTTSSHDSKTSLSDRQSSSYLDRHQYQRSNLSSVEDNLSSVEDLRHIEGVLGIAGLMITSIIYCVLQHTYSNEMFHFGMKIRVSSTSVIYRKVNDSTHCKSLSSCVLT